jgi:hypothetical protein
MFGYASHVYILLFLLLASLHYYNTTTTFYSLLALHSNIFMCFSYLRILYNPCIFFRPIHNVFFNLLLQYYIISYVISSQS